MGTKATSRLLAGLAGVVGPGLLLIASCDTGATPASVAVEYRRAIQGQNYESARELLSDSARVKIEKLYGGIDAFFETIEDRQEKVGTDRQIRDLEVSETHVEGDTAQVTITAYYEQGGSRSDQMTMVRDREGWRVSPISY